MIYTYHKLYFENCARNWKKKFCFDNGLISVFCTELEIILQAGGEEVEMFCSEGAAKRLLVNPSTASLHELIKELIKRKVNMW